MSSVFLNKIDIEVMDSNTQELENCFVYVKGLITPDMQDPDVYLIIRGAVTSGDSERVCKGLVYGILYGLDWAKHLFGFADMLPTACSTLASLVPMLKSRGNAISVFTRLWKLSCHGFNDLFLTVLRTFDIISELKSELEWLKTSSFLSLVFYKVVRLATINASDGSPLLSDYTSIITFIWRNKRDACLAIGRDLMRVISPLSEVNGLELIWNDLFSPSRDGVPLYWALLCTPTHPKFHSVLLVPALEAKLVYVIENASPGNYTRYLKWITEEYEENIISDIVRFIVTFPSNVESTPRWQIVAYLLTCSADHQTQANIKQALIFDCLFYNQQDQLHTIEPLMSILKFSISRFPQVAEEILEFLLSSAELYDKRSVAGMMRSLKECFNIAYYNRIIPSLESLISEEKIDSTIRSRISDLFDTSGSGSEPSQSPIYDEETPPNTPRNTEFIGEATNDFAIDPSYEKLQQILEKNPVSKELALHVLKCIGHEFLPISSDLQRNAIFYQIFAKASQDENIFGFLKVLYAADSAIGIRLLIFTIQTKGNLYFRLEFNLERDLKACSDEASLDTLNWIYPYLMQKQLFTSKIFFQFLSTATSELFYYTELDLCRRSYKLLSPCLDEILMLSNGISSTEKLYLWRLIAAEIHPQQVNYLIGFCMKYYSPENWSGLLSYLKVNNKHVKVDTVIGVLGLPFHLSSTAAAILSIFDIALVRAI